jgi:hypothetical protein
MNALSRQPGSDDDRLELLDELAVPADLDAPRPAEETGVPVTRRRFPRRRPVPVPVPAPAPASDPCT